VRDKWREIIAERIPFARSRSCVTQEPLEKKYRRGNVGQIRKSGYGKGTPRPNWDRRLCTAIDPDLFPADLHVGASPACTANKKPSAPRP